MKCTFLAALLAFSAGAQAQLYKDKTATPEARAKSIVAEMTLEEKVSLMMHSAPAIERLGIRRYNWWNEALHGVGRAGLATVFPQPIGMAASWDDPLLFRVFDATSTEARAKNNEARRKGSVRQYQGLTFWTPNVNLFRDPRWGRGHETYGEDPYLTAVLGVQVVRGLQGPADAQHNKLHACAKHFAIHSGPEWNRHSYDAKDIAPRDLAETYLPAFKALVQKGGVKEVMCAYNRYEGEPCCGNNRLLQQILRDEWGYEGIVLSDCWAVNDFYVKGRHETEPDPEHATAKAVRSGTDLECGNSYGSLVQAVHDGLVSEAAIDRSIIRLMKARYELGEMDNEADVEWQRVPMSVVDSKEHRDLALRMARESMVLLQNRDHLLPLNRGMKIAVLGPNANDSVMQWGNYNGFPSHTSTLLSALRERLPEDNVIYDPACDHTSQSSIQSLFDRCEANGQPGFAASYWNTLDEELPATPDVTAQVGTAFHFTTAGATVFAPGVSLREFTGHYETVFRAERDEEIAFSLQLQGHAVLSIDGEEVFEGGNMKSGNVYSLHVEAGRSYRIGLTFRATEGDCCSLNFDFGRRVPLDPSATLVRVADADVVIFAGGISPQLEGEEMPVHIPGFKGGDRDLIELPEVQRMMLRRLHEAGKRVVFVNYSGSAIALPMETQWADAIVQAWYPGQAGGDALADVLLGDYNPAGRLPVTFYRSTADLPDFEDYSMQGRTYRYFGGTPLFCFGHGLSYTTFRYGQPRVSAATVKAGKGVTLTVPVTNAGERDGEEVVQVYLARIGDTEGPQRALRAFRRVSIPAGKTVNVQLRLEADQLEWFDPRSNVMGAVPGSYQLLVGPSSDVQQLQPVALTIR